MVTGPNSAEISLHGWGERTRRTLLPTSRTLRTGEPAPRTYIKTTFPRENRNSLPGHRLPVWEW
jgi:hypothetical protein